MLSASARSPALEAGLLLLPALKAGGGFGGATLGALSTAVEGATGFVGEADLAVVGAVGAGTC
jgi:hypothetical protein